MAEDAEHAAADNELAPERVAELARSGKAELIDVRREHEWEAGRLAGARNVEVNELTAQAAIPKGRTVVFYCRGGNRSGMAAQAFREAGWDAHSISGGIGGGIAAWAEAGLPLEPDGGVVAEPRPPAA
jgi:rhodanese-related sulfurtransferase